MDDPWIRRLRKCETAGSTERTAWCIFAYSVMSVGSSWGGYETHTGR
jgi:hypothetical protein